MEDNERAGSLTKDAIIHEQYNEKTVLFIFSKVNLFFRKNNIHRLATTSLVLFIKRRDT